MTGQQNVSKTYFLFQMVLAITAISSTMKRTCVVDSVDAEIREESSQYEQWSGTIMDVNNQMSQLKRAMKFA